MVGAWSTASRLNASLRPPRRLARLGAPVPVGVFGRHVGCVGWSAARGGTRGGLDMSAANGPRGDRARSWPIGRRRGVSAAALLLTASLAVAISAPVAVAGAAPSKGHSDRAGTAAGGPLRSCESLGSVPIADATHD